MTSSTRSLRAVEAQDATRQLASQGYRSLARVARDCCPDHERGGVGSTAPYMPWTRRLPYIVPTARRGSGCEFVPRLQFDSATQLASCCDCGGDTGWVTRSRI
jgi:hypothetical protein